MNMFFAILLSAIPTLLYTTCLWWLDRYEKEPWPLLLAVFGWGAVPTVAIVLMAQLPTGIDTLGSEPQQSVFIAPLIEEPIKALALVAVFAFFRYEFDGVLDGIIYGSLIGFGFAMTENGLYFYRHGSTLSSLLWIRVILFGFNHAFYTSLIGVALGLVRYEPRRWVGYVMMPFALILAIAFHALHNITASFTFPGVLIAWLISSGGVLIVLLVAVIAWKRERYWIDSELLEEVEFGLIDQETYSTVRSTRLRIASQWRAFLRGGWSAVRSVRSLHHLLTELAFLKYQLRIGDCHCRPSDLIPLRHRILEGMSEEQVIDDRR